MPETDLPERSRAPSPNPAAEGAPAETDPAPPASGKNAGKTLVLLRHGESAWNRANRFTGWIDVPLTDRGREQARRAGKQLREAGIVPAAAHTSVLRRAEDTLREVRARAGWETLPTRRAWELNERHYGALQGLNKAETERRHGAEQTNRWRRSYAERPPPVAPDDPRHPAQDPRYRDLPPDRLPAGESLRDTAERVLPYWETAIAPDLARGPVLVVAHGNSLRALVMRLERLTPEEIRRRDLPTGIPLVFTLDAALRPLTHRYLGDRAALAQGLALAHGRP